MIIIITGLWDLPGPPSTAPEPAARSWTSRYVCYMGWLLVVAYMCMYVYIYIYTYIYIYIHSSTVLNICLVVCCCLLHGHEPRAFGHGRSACRGVPGRSPSSSRGIPENVCSREFVIEGHWEILCFSISFTHLPDPGSKYADPTQEDTCRKSCC